MRNTEAAENSSRSIFQKIHLQRGQRQALEKNEVTKGISQLLLKTSNLSTDEALEVLGTSEKGLSVSEVRNRLQKYGKNEVDHEKAPSWFSQLVKAFANPFIGVLAVLMTVSVVTDVYLAAPEDVDFKTIIVLSIMITVSGLLRFVTEFRSTKAAESLKRMVRTTATVKRIHEELGESVKIELPLEEIVPGDVILLGAGDMIPGDVRLLSSKDLTVSQSILTGESIPVEKFDILGNSIEKSASGTGINKTNVLEAQNICFMGTNVVAGTGTAVVVTTGSRTYFGSMAKNIVGHRALTSFDRGVNSVTWLLIRFMLVMVPIIFLINGVLKGDWMEAFLFGIAVAVGLTPEMLPMIVSANLAKGALLLAKKKCIVKRINAIQNLGAMDVLCTDKTGTLTRDKIILERYIDLSGNKSPDVLDYTYLNGFHQTGLKNLLDRAVLEHVDIQNEARTGRNFEKVDEVPFDFTRKRMSVVLKKTEASHLLICKGAVEEIVERCRFYEEKIENSPDTACHEMTKEAANKAIALSHELNSEGLRVVAVAIKEISNVKSAYAVTDESAMTLCGFVAFMDPPKESAESAIQALINHGVAVKVLTGDSGIIAKNVCQQVGLTSASVILGSDLDAWSEDQLKEVVKRETIFAKLSPMQKSKIVRALQASGHTVGFLGDGINDAAALRDADVGISVDSAADIAKESADIIMLEKDLMVLEEGVIEGRNVFGNIMKYIKMTASSNFGNVFSVLVASAFLPFLPMLPIHLLIQNVLYDLSQTTLPFDRVDEEYLRKPRKWLANDIGRFMIFIGPISSIFDIATYALMWFVFKANAPEHQSLFQSGWFIEGLLSQTLIVHMIRTQKIPFFQSRAAWPVMITTMAIVAVGIALPFTHFGATVGLIPLPMSYFPWLVAILLSYCVLTQFLKMAFIRKFHSWI